MSRLYFAYGSNLNVTQMAMRCPNAKQLGALYIPNWKLVFRGVADIEPSRNSDDLLPVGVWEITKECEDSLDVYEGVENGLYNKVSISGMMTYRMTSNNISPPSKHYFNSIFQGYKDFELNSQHLYEALGWSHHLSEQYEWSGRRFQPTMLVKGESK